MAPYLNQKTADGLTLARNQEDFTTDSWTALQAQISSTQKLLAKTDFTKADVEKQAQALQSAINNLQYVNVGLLATQLPTIPPAGSVLLL